MIFNSNQLGQLDSLYSQYNDTIKPLLIQVESRYESLPTPIHNELRSFNDHIARCYIVGATEQDIDNELRKAAGHIKRTIFDCFKFLNVKLYDINKDFEKKTKRVDLTKISNGTFYIKYRDLVVEAQKAVRDAKQLESDTRNHDAAFTKYENAFLLYSELEVLINENVSNVNWARVKSMFSTLGVIIYSIVIFFIGTVVSLIIEDLIEGKCNGQSTLDCIIKYIFK